MDSNHRRRCQQIYSLPPLATREHSHIYFYSIVNKNGAGGRTRTPDLLITNQLLYQLSYTSVSTLDYYIINKRTCQEENLIFFTIYFLVIYFCKFYVFLLFIGLLRKSIDFLFQFFYNTSIFNMFRHLPEG